MQLAVGAKSFVLSIVRRREDIGRLWELSQSMSKFPKAVILRISLMFDIKSLCHVHFAHDRRAPAPEMPRRWCPVGLSFSDDCLSPMLEGPFTILPK